MLKSLLAGVGTDIPNFITLISDYFGHHEWAPILEEWENVVFSFFVATLLSIIFYQGARKKELIPSGLQNFLELLIEKFSNAVTEILGPEGIKYVPFLGTLFIYILAMNFIGLFPLMKSPSSNLSITIALALCVFGLVQYLNVKHMGFWGFLHHLAGSPKNAIGWALAPLMFPIEILTQISRPVTLALRLFGNVLGEKILIGFFSMAGITLLFFAPLQLPFMFLGLLTGFIQATVFTLLSTIYILLSFPHAEEEGHH